jgi:hypothetical protein
MTKSIQTDPDQEDTFFINKIKIDVAKSHNVCQSVIEVFYSDIAQEYCIYIKSKWVGYYELDEFNL